MANGSRNRRTHLRGLWCWVCSVSFLISAERGFASDLVLTVESAVEMAIENGVAVAAQNAAVDARKLDVDAANTVWRPALKGQFALQYANGQPNSFFAVHQITEPGARLQKATGGYGSGALTFLFPLYQKGAWYQGATPEVLQAEATLHQADAERAQKLVETGTKVAKLCFAFLQGKQELSLREDNHKHSVELRRYIQPRVKAGIDSPTEYQSAEASVAKSFADLKSTEDLIEYNRRLLGSYLSSGQDNVDVNESAVADPVLPNIDRILEYALQAEPSIITAEANIELARAKMQEMKAISSPTLAFSSSITAANNMENYEEEATPYFYAVGFSLSMPITDFGATSANVRAKQQAITEAELKKDAQREQVRQNVLSAFYALKQSLLTMDSVRVKADAARQQGKETRERLTKGVSGVDEWAKSEESDLSAQLELIKTRFSAWSKYADLYQSIGLPYGAPLPAGQSE